MSVTITDLMRRTSDTSLRIQRLLATFDKQPPRSPAAKFAGLHAGLPQCARSGERLEDWPFINRDESPDHGG